MTYLDKQIVETYSELFEGLSAPTKIELIESLSKSLKVEQKAKEELFLKSFGAFSDEKSPEEIISEIKSKNLCKRKGSLT